MNIKTMKKQKFGEHTSGTEHKIKTIEDIKSIKHYEDKPVKENI